MTDKTELPGLLPCPFCGAAATYEQVDNGGHIGDLRWSAGCNTDGCIGQQSVITYQRKRDVAGAWNTRAPAAVAEGWVLASKFILGRCAGALMEMEQFTASGRRSYPVAETLSWVIADLRRMLAAAPAPAESKPADAGEVGGDVLADLEQTMEALRGNDGAHGAASACGFLLKHSAALKAALRGEGA